MLFVCEKIKDNNNNKIGLFLKIQDYDKKKNKRPT